MKLIKMNGFRNTILKCLVAAVLTMPGNACNEDDIPSGKDEPHTGAVQPKGKTIGTLENFQIDKNGGLIRSANGMLEIDIPQDALSGATTIGIQAIENTAPNGTGNGYRLTPHDIEFKKPVAITFTYDDRTISFEDGCGVAFQGDDGIWYWPGNIHRDKGNRKVSIQTTHFSDWSLFESMKLLPPKAAVEPGGIVNLIAYRVIPENEIEDLLAPLVDVPMVPLGEPVFLENKYITKWEIIGDGALNPSGNTATYLAPVTVPNDNAVVVNLHVKLSSSTGVLTSYIAIGQGEVILDGGPYDNFKASSLLPASATYLASQNSITLIQFNVAAANSEGVYDNVLLIQVMFPGNTTGQFEWNDENCNVYATDPIEGTIHAIAGTVIKNPDADPDEEVIINSGHVRVDEYGAVGEIVSGSFAGDFTFIDSSCQCISHGKIEGAFVGKRDPDL